MNNNGWVKLHRKFLDWEWYDDINAKILFIHLLLVANHKDKKWRGVTIKRGQKLTSYLRISEETGLSIAQVRTALNKLKSTREITHLRTRNYSIITINKYDEYQTDDTHIDSPMTDEQQSDDKPLTTNKNDKNIKNEKKRAFPLKGVPDSGFALFWGKYPKKKDRARAEKLFTRKVRDVDTFKKVMSGLERALKEWEGKDEQYIPYPTTWLNGERWEDEFTTSEPVRPKLT
jgi:hypothetical protein